MRTLTRICRLLKNEDGPTIVEYAVLIALIICVCVGSISLVGGGTTNFWEHTRVGLDSALSGS